jgi:outer membrane immunogenic protein
MRRLLLTGAISSALTIVAALGTHAADLPLKSSPPPYVLPASWTGFYLGANAGGGWEHQTFNQAFYIPGFVQFSTPGPPNLLAGTSGNGAIFGGQFGYNWQGSDNWVVGVEADISGTTIKGTQSVTNTGPVNGVAFTDSEALETRIRDLGTARAKLGFTPWDSILIYGTGGLAWGQVNETFTPNSTSPFGIPLIHVGMTTQFGWSAGAGADWRIGRNVILGVLYLHYDLGSTNQTVIAVTPNASTAPIFLPPSHLTVDAVTARFSWLFK